METFEAGEASLFESPRARRSDSVLAGASPPDAFTEPGVPAGTPGSRATAGPSEQGVRGFPQPAPSFSDDGTLFASALTATSLVGGPASGSVVIGHGAIQELTSPTIPREAAAWLQAGGGRVGSGTGTGSGGGAHVGQVYLPDDTSPGVRIAGPDVLTEGGTSGAYSVVLKKAPTSNVVVEITTPHTSALSISTSTLTFTPSNWSTAQVVNVAALANSTVEGYHGAAILSSTGTSSDPNYDSINGDTFTVNILDANGPNAVADTALTDRDVSISGIDVLSNDWSPNGYTLTVTGYTQGELGGTVTLGTGQTFSYTPPTGVTDLDRFTYTIGDGHGGTTVGSVFVTVAPVNRAPTLSSISNRTNAEDDAVSVPVSASDLDNDALYFSATNLPLGVRINERTGELTGVLAANASHPDPFQPYTGSHTYNVAVQVTDSEGATATANFNWTVNHTNHGPWVEFPGAHIWMVMTSPSIQIVGHDEDNEYVHTIDQITYSATGLPTNLSINSQTGVISGTLMPGSEGTHQPQVTVSDGQASDTKSFTLTVLPCFTAYGPAAIWLNETSDTADDVTLDGEPVTTTISGSPGATVNLSVSGPATLSHSQVTLDAQGRATVTVTPTALSQAVGDIRVVASILAQGQPVKSDEKELTNLTITLPDLAYEYLPERYNELPAGSQNHTLYRIPKNLGTFYTVTLSLDLSKTKHAVKLERVAPQNAGNFKFRDDKNQDQDILLVKKRESFISLRGVTLTEPGQHGKLYVKGTAGKVSKQMAKGFSVSAVPIKLRYKDSHRNTTSEKFDLKFRKRDGGIDTHKMHPYSIVLVYWFDSDTGPRTNAALQDLDKVWIGEFMTFKDAVTNPPWKVTDNIAANTSYVLPERSDTRIGPMGILTDQLLIFGDTLPVKQASTVRMDQWFGFRDGRSETTNGNDKTHAYQNDMAYWQQIRKIEKVGTEWYYDLTRVSADTPPEPEPANPFRILIP